VLLAFPRAEIIGDVALGAFFECHLPRGFRLGCALLSVPNFDRVLTFFS
jgi:hypothetical protein